MKKVFYDKATNNEIFDISGKKTLDDVKRDFGDSDWQEISIENSEAVEIRNGVMVKFDKRNKKKSENSSKILERKAAIGRIKVKLGLTNSDIDDLVKALK